MRFPLSIKNLAVRRSTSFCLQLDSLNLAPGLILGVAGPNGSGKSTLLETLAGLQKLDSGEIALMGQKMSSNLRRTKAILGYIPDDEDWFVAELTAHEYLELLEKVYSSAGATVRDNRVPRLAELLHFTNWDQPLDTLSHGNKKKVQIIAGLMHDPKVIIIDELRNGLDPLAIIAAERIIRAEAMRGAAVVAATHDLWWAERVADEVLLLDNGAEVVRDETKRLIRRYGSLEKLFLETVNGAGIR